MQDKVNNNGIVGTIKTHEDGDELCENGKC
jgi:hypothetical protein